MKRRKSYNQKQATGRTVRRSEPKVGRNAPCPCGSGSKHKRCCLGNEATVTPLGGDVYSISIPLGGAPAAPPLTGNTTMGAVLAEAGVEVPPLHALPRESVGDKIIETARTLADRGYYLTCTDHLSDEELYGLLVDHLLEVTVPDPAAMNRDGRGPRAFEIDLSDGLDGDCHDFLQYYADEETRRRFADFFDLAPPPPRARPFDRDRHLPQIEDGGYVEHGTLFLPLRPNRGTGYSPAA